jgi:hypothetical protein
MAGLSDRLVAGWGAISSEPVSDRGDLTFADFGQGNGSEQLKSTPPRALRAPHFIAAQQVSPPKAKAQADLELVGGEVVDAPRGLVKPRLSKTPDPALPLSR